MSKPMHLFLSTCTWVVMLTICFYALKGVGAAVLYVVELDDYYASLPTPRACIDYAPPSGCGELTPWRN